MWSHGVKWSIGDAPQLVADVARLGQARALGVVDAEARVGEAVAVGVDLGLAVDDREQLDDAPVRGGLPLAVVAVVVAGRDDAADREAEEVVDVVDDRLVEPDLGGAGGDASSTDSSAAYV